ncbi:MAG TPA: Smr/MutS family protein [Longimicrobiales bacterium]|nr:Smr/MutS family protein [Longimicrobiales bacterium]
MKGAARDPAERAAAHALAVLGLDDALALVAAHAASPLGAEAIRALRPAYDEPTVVEEMARVAAMHQLLADEPAWMPTAVPDARQPLKAASAVGSVLAGAGLVVISRLLEASRSASAQLDALDEASPLREFRERLHTDDALRKRIDTAIDEDGAVRDGASRALRDLRGELEQARSRIVRELERYAAGLPERVRVPDASVSVRDGRYVIAIRREGRSVVGGLVHDESASGNTLFVEPPVGIELMNRVRELERAETREVRRILAELSDAVRPAVPELRASLDALIGLDSLVGRARYALSVGAEPPTIAPADGPRLRIVGGSHPLLHAEGPEPVPFDLELGPDEATLVVSGPNTGGKTVLLKAIGLLAALHQAGVVGPLRAGTQLRVFRGFFADIGDEQSIEASLSTFSAHLRNLRQLLEAAHPGALVLIDELGSGTDPAEGAALARAILESLTRAGVTTVASTHLGALKRLAGEEAGVENASMEFDAAALAPTYRLRKGVPGRSYGLAIARRLGLPEDLVARGEELMPDAEREAERLLADLERKGRAAEAALREAEQRAERARAREEEVAARERAVELREREVEVAATEGARQMLLEARAEVDAAIAEVRRAGAGSIEDAASQARGRVEAAARDHAARSERVRRATPEPERDARTLRQGDAVRVRATGARGVLAELRDGEAVVEVRGVRLRLSAAELDPDRSPADTAPEGRPAPRPPPPDIEASSEVDLRGLRAEEVASRLHPALDAAVVADLGSLRVIHGKGHGILRDVVAELLAADRRVVTARPGGVGEGGAGVTVAEFR